MLIAGLGEEKCGLPSLATRTTRIDPHRLVWAKFWGRFDMGGFLPQVRANLC